MFQVIILSGCWWLAEISFIKLQNVVFYPFVCAVILCRCIELENRYDGLLILYLVVFMCDIHRWYDFTKMGVKCVTRTLNFLVMSLLFFCIDNV